MKEDLVHKATRGRRPIDIGGQRFGRLVARERLRGDTWRCQCDCGASHAARAGALRYGTVRSCGCLFRDTKTRHGHARKGACAPEYTAWRGMVSRCHNPKNPGYHRYGGRGIEVCAEWRADFAAFLAAMGHRPTAMHSVDRIDNNGPYAPGNCRWATKKEQGRNQSRTLLVEGRPLIDVCEERGLIYETVYMRMRRGISWPEAAEYKPRRRRRGQ